MSKQSELNAVYRQVRSNYLRNIRSMESRGYEFDRDMRPDIPKRITEGSIRRIQKLNQNRYQRASYNGYKGEEARRAERADAARRAKLRKQGDEARLTLDQLGAALVFEVEQARPGGTTETFLNGLVQDIEGVIEQAESDDAFAIQAASTFEASWDEIQRAIEIIEYYKNIEDAPGYLVDRLVMLIRQVQGKTVTQEDMQMVGDLSEADYYPTE